MAAKRSYKRLDVRHVYTDESSVYLVLPDGMIVRIRRVKGRDFSSAVTAESFSTDGEVHEVTPDEIMHSDSVAF